MGASRPLGSGLTIAKLAREWAGVTGLATLGGDPSMSAERVEPLLAELIDRLVTAVASDPVDEQAAMGVAAELVAHGLVESGSIARSIEILGGGLPRLTQLQHADRRDAAVLQVLAALSGGYAQALRQRGVEGENQATQDAERALRVCQARFRQILSAVAVGIAISDLDGTVVIANRAFARIVDRAPEDVTGAVVAELLQAGDDPELGVAYGLLTSGGLTHFTHECQLKNASGEVAWASVAGLLLHDPDGVPTHHLVIAEDITELRLLQQGLSEQALHDMLTGLPNEHYFMSRLRDVIEGAHPLASVTVCRVNLDNFAVINDGVGRDDGERLLRSVARRLQELVIGDRAMVARMGADDFAILIEDGMDSRDLGMFAATINVRLCEPVYINDRGMAVSAGVGVVSRPAGRVSADELIQAADITLHRAKRSGRGQWGLDDPQADARERERYQLAAEIPGAWENGEIDVHYQPVCRLEDGWIVGLQASLRWERADGTVVGHSECLALAEQTGLVFSLGPWIVEKACRVQIDVLHCRHERAPLMQVNLTAQLSQDPDLVGVVRGALSFTGLGAEQLRVGVPLARGRGDVVDNVRTLAELGVEVVLLDAAAGPGHLAYLEDLPVGAVEIAPDIVARVAQRPEDDSVVARAARAAISLVHSTGATLTVPGVDTPEQAQWWRSAEADTAWGTHFGPPVPAPYLYTLLAHL